MKIFIAFSIGFLVSTVGFGQQAQTNLLFDERGKYIFYEVVETPTVLQDSILNRTQFFFENYKKKNVKLKSVVNDSLFQAEGKFIINKGTSLLIHPSGEVRFDFVAEIKGGKYRFWLTDFKFIPYQRDRYGNFVPASSIYKPLENKPGKLNAADWKDNIAATAGHAYNLGESFKKVLAGKYIHKTETKPKTISKQKW